MNAIPEYGTGRHEDYLSQQDERAEVARDLAAEQDHAEWLGWMDAQGYPLDTGDRPEHALGDLRDAFTAGMQAARDLASAQEPQPAPALAEAIRAYCKQKADEFSAEVFPVRPQDMRVSAADILAIVDRAGNGG